MRTKLHCKLPANLCAPKLDRNICRQRRHPQTFSGGCSKIKMIRTVVTLMMLSFMMIARVLAVTEIDKEVSEYRIRAIDVDSEPENANTEKFVVAGVDNRHGHVKGQSNTVVQYSTFCSARSSFASKYCSHQQSTSRLTPCCCL